jgi:hypothetical protein
MFDKRLNIFTGHFGSGKTEVAVNFAIKLAELKGKTAIVDLDIVNPYFRTADARKELEERNIRVITSIYANTNVDVPSLPPEINSLFEEKELRVVLDIGGDDLGAKAVSRYRDEILQEDFELFFVVNTKRIMTDTPDKIEEMIYSIEQSARIKITGLVNNTNLLQDTSSSDIIEGERIIKIVSQKLNIPISFSCGFYNVINPIQKNINSNILCMQKFIKLPWD